MGMSKNELNEIKSRYLQEELYILFSKNLNKLDWNVNQGKKLINFNYDKFTFEYSYKNINKNEELDENKTLYEKISIVDSNKSYENLYPALSNVEEIINKRIKWILERI